MKPKQLFICGIPYQVVYCDSVKDIDPINGEPLVGNVDLLSRVIRVYDNGRSLEDIWYTIIHEVLHAIGYDRDLPILDYGGDCDKDKHEQLDQLALVLMDFLFRNHILNNADTGEVVNGFKV